MRTIPTLDLRLWPCEPARFARELRSAMHKVGFFQLRHSRGAVCSEALRTAASFFALSETQKAAIDYRNSPAFRGYMPLGVENTAGQTDMREQIEFAAEGPAAAPDAWPPYRRLVGPNQWPSADLAPQLQPSLIALAAHLSAVAGDLSDAICTALELPPTALDPIFADEAHWQLKIARYVPAPPPAMGVGAHSDSGFLTLLLQDTVGGLQVHSHGEWIDVPPAGPDVLVCNLGEVAELITGGYLRATPHRVLSTGEARMSIPFFYNPRLSARVSPLQLPSSLPWERSERDEESRWRDARQHAQLAEYGLNAFKSLARSHPEVMARHHPDLELGADGRIVRRDGPNGP